MSCSAERGSISLRDVLKKFKSIGARDLSVSRTSTNHLNPLQGTLFVAVMDSDDDGHNHVDKAVANGCIGILAERFVTAPVPVFIVSDTRRALQDIERELLGDPASQLHTIGVTGTYGKTACSHLLHHLFSANAKKVGLITDLEVHDGQHAIDGWYQSSNARSNSETLDQMLQNGCTHAILECHSEGLVNHQYDSVSLDAAVITRIRNAHTTIHGTIGNYRRAKARIIDLLKPDGVAILNSDDPNTRFHLPRITNPALTIGIHTDADITAHDIVQSMESTIFSIDAGGALGTIELPLIGTQHIYHALQATALGLTAGMTLDSICEALSNIRPIPGHMQQVQTDTPFSVFVDVANSADTLVVALQSLRAVTTGRLICVFGPNGDTTAGERRQMGTVVERLADVSAVTENNIQDLEFLDIAHDCMDGFEHPGRLSVIPSRIHAIDWAIGEAEPGDTVLVSGKGFNTLHHVGSVLQDFDDLQITRMLLRDPEPFSPLI